jgi:phenylacetate-CoA ligase
MHPSLHNMLLHGMTPLRFRLYKMILSRTAWGAERIRQYQEEQLRDLIRYCWENVPFYRSRWRSYISDPREIQTIRDLQKLPILTKDELRQELDALTTTVPKLRGTPARSGGSTGRPTAFRMNKHDEEMAWAQMYVAWSWAGFRPGLPFLVVGGESLGVGLGDKRTWKDWVVNRWVTSGSNLTRDRAQALAESPHFHQIAFIYGYPNAIRELGELLVELGVRPRSLRGVVCTAEVMRQEVRERISDLFGVPVNDQYGLNDGGLLAAEGPNRDGLHVFFHRAILEVLDQHDRQTEDLGKAGRAIATSLTNLATPFVRYETGDELHWRTRDPAPTGIAWPRIGPVDGRTGDVMFLPSGRRIAMPGLTLVMRWLDGLHAYQFIQTGPRAVCARLERGPGFRMTDDEVLAYLRSKITDEADWSVLWGPPELTLSGKLLVIRNDWLRGQGLSRPPQA